MATAAAASSPAMFPLRSFARNNPSRAPGVSFNVSLIRSPCFTISSRKHRAVCCSWSSPEAGSCAPRKGIWSIRDDLVVSSTPYFLTEVQGGQGSPPTVQENFQSVVSQLFQHRIVRCGGQVDDDMHGDYSCGSSSVPRFYGSYKGVPRTLMANMQRFLFS